MSLLPLLVRATLCLLFAWCTTAMPAVTYQAAGTAVSGSTGVGASPAWPIHAANDIALLFVESAGEEPVTLGVPNGFTAVANSPQSTGTGTNGTRLTVFWARATSAAMATPSISTPSNHFYAQIVTFRGVLNSGNPIDATAGGTKAAASTSVTLPGVTTTVANALIVQAVARHNDSAAAAFSAQTNVNLTGITEHIDAGTANGHGGGIGVWSGVKAAAGATGSTTATVTSSINAFLTLALKPQPGPRFQAAGTAAGGTGAVSPAWPAHAIDDIALLFVESSGGQPATLSVAAGFAAVANSPQAVGAGTAGTRLTVFWARATSAAMTAPTVADPGNHVYAQILTYRGVANAGNPWDVTGGGTKTPASTTGNVPGVTTTLASTLVVQAISRDTDSATAAFSAQANVNLDGLAERVDAGTTAGNGGGIAVWDGYKATAGATGTTTATVSSSINAYLTIALKPSATTAPVLGIVGTAATTGLNWPAHAVGDVALLFVETAGGQSPTLTDPAGFVAVSGSPQATGAGTAGTRLSAYWARATSTSMGGPTIGGLTDHVHARILSYRGAASTGDPWNASGGGVKAAASTSVSLSSVTTTVPNTLVVQAVARDNDNAAAAFSAQANANLTGIAERHDAGTATGLGGGFAVWDGALAAAGATGGTTATVTSSINAFLTIALRPAATQPDHYELSLPASSVACQAGTVTVTACADSSSPCTNPSTTVAGQTANLSATSCTLGSMPISFNASGVATTTLNCSSVGDGVPFSVTLSGESMATSPVANARKCCQGGTCTVTDTCDATNKTAGFLFSTSAGGAEAALGTQQAGVASATRYLRAIQTNTTTFACEAALTGANSVNLAYECLDPTTCSASDLMSINGGTPTTIARNNNGSVGTYTAVNLTFDGSGNAPFTVNFSDVGRTRLHAAKAAGGSLLTALAGVSLPFVIAPYDFSVVPSGPYAAGNSFSARVTARASGGAATPNFGRETSPETVVLKAVSAAAVSATNSQLVGPATGQPGTLTPGSFTLGKCAPAASGTVCETELAWTEVGDLTLSAAIANAAGYLASGSIPWGSAAAGPFTPAYLTTEFHAGQPCGSFAYSGQPFRIKVSAMSAANAVLGTAAALTQNYTGSYAKAVTLGKDDAGSCVPTVTGFSNNTLAAADFDATPGYATTPVETNVSAPLPISYAQGLAAPATFSVCARDADGINSHGRTQAALTIRNGRLRLSNAYGSELLPLRVPAVAEYYNGAQWTANAADSCTSVPAAAVGLSGGMAASTSASAVTLSGGTGTLTLAKPSPSAAGTVDLALNLGATGTTNDVSCNASSPATTAANLPWLQFAWCAGKLDPNARVKFGSPKAPYIYLRERY
ncbi:MAG: hypothetical protein HZB40_00355 [Rhodocyclales bacterium]|nr:hypothetical protein [Rhodocyclales bacterium]